MKKQMTRGLSAMVGVLTVVAAVGNATAQDHTGGPIQVQAPGWDSPFAGSTLWDECDVQECTECNAGGCGNWFVGMNALIFNRDNDDNVFLTYQDSDGAPLLYSRNADMDWSGGFELRFGRYFNGGRTALEAVYWGIYPDTQGARFLAADAVGGLGTPLPFDSLYIDPTGANTAVADYYNGAVMHHVRRDFEVHNVEINLLGLAGACGGCGGCAQGGCAQGGYAASGCGGGVAFTWMLGPRFLRFREDMLFATDLVDRAFTGTADELAYQIDVENNLVGFQIGGRGDFCLGRRCSFYSGIKMGLFGNDINHHQHIITGDGQYAAVNDVGSPFDGAVYNINSGKEDASMIGELDLGFNIRMSQCWSANLGYRAVGISGIALSTSQVPRDLFDNIQGVRSINSNGNLILHGGYAGITFNY